MKNKWTLIGSLLAVVLLALAVGPGQAQGPGPQGDVGVQAALGTAFTYQGQLKSGGNPVNGNCDFQFSLWDAVTDGTQIGTTQTKTNVSVSNGLFTTSLDFGSAFTGDARWLAIAVRCPAGSGSYTNLSPRQALTAAPYALGLRPGAYIQGSVGVGGVVWGDNTSTSAWGWGMGGTSAGGFGVYGKATATSGTTSGVWGESNSPEGRGVSGYANATSGTTYGVYGESKSTAGAGVYGVNTSSGTGVTGVSSTGDGVRGESSGANKSGVYGVNTNSSGFGVYGRNTGAGSVGYLGGTYGVYGESASTTGRGVSGYANATSGTTYGVYGESKSTAGAGVYGVNTSSGTGVAGISSTGNGVRGESSGANKSGVYGRSNSTAGYGVHGWATATSGYTYGVYGESASTTGRGVDGHATATSGEAIGVYGQSASTGGTGVYGWAVAGSGNTAGVYGRSTSPYGVGVRGYAEANSNSAIGVYGTAPSLGYAGYFSGKVHVQGDFSASGNKAFKIDHPLDPAGRYLYHFAQEGPEVQNVYNGVVTLDASGEAVVALPAYFEALNAGPYRYQLTAIGAPMPNLYIAQKIQGHTFRIAGGVPGMEVSWEVTAVRHDPYLRDHPVQAEVDKPDEEQGTYLYPQGYGRPKEMGLDYQRNADLLERMPESPSTGGGE